MVHADVHVEVLDCDVELTDAFLVLLASDIEFVAHFLQLCDIFSILGDSLSILRNVSI